ncbi:hypothetical protein YC2023_045725 [Brassica napus]
MGLALDLTPIQALPPQITFVIQIVCDKFPSNDASTARPPLLTASKSQTLIPLSILTLLTPTSLLSSTPLLSPVENYKLPISQPSPAAPLTAPLATLPLTVSSEKSGKSNLDNFKVIPLKLFSPIQNNRASFSIGHVPITLPPPSVDLNPILPTPVPAVPPKPSKPQPLQTLLLSPPQTLPNLLTLLFRPWSKKSIDLKTKLFVGSSNHRRIWQTSCLDS